MGDSWPAGCETCGGYHDGPCREPEVFSLDRTENPHPLMLERALLARANARVAPVPLYRDFVDWRSYWRGYLAAMCAATGESPEDIEAWMDRNAVRPVDS